MNAALFRSKAILAGSLLISCRNTPPTENTEKPASPQAHAEPAPLTNPANAVRSGTAGPAPTAMRSDRGIVAEIPPRETQQYVVRDGSVIRETREPLGISLDASLRTSELPGPPRGGEVNIGAIDLARRRMDPKLTIDLTANRARFAIAGGGFVLPIGTELRARTDYYGHILLLPDEQTYRTVAPGSLRSLFGERRLDVAPLSLLDLRPNGEGGKRANLRTRRVEVATRAAKASFEIAVVREAGEGGELVCRWLLDLMNAPPSAPLCETDEIPLHAEFRWNTKGALTFDVHTVARRGDITPQTLATPPAQKEFTDAPLPIRASEVLLTRGELASMRTAAIDVPPPAPDAQAPPESGIVASNQSDLLRIFAIDGVAAAWIAPGAREHLPALPRGRYTVQWRSFLGDALEPPEVLSVPSIAELRLTEPAKK